MKRRLLAMVTAFIIILSSSTVIYAGPGGGGSGGPGEPPRSLPPICCEDPMPYCPCEEEYYLRPCYPNGPRRGRGRNLRQHRRP